MKVLFWSELFWPYLGGVEILAATFLTAMHRRGVEFVVITSHGHLDLPDEGDHAGIPIHRLPFRAALSAGDLPQLLRARRRVADLKRKFAPDLVHMFALGPSALLQLQTAGSMPVPLLVTLHGEVLRKEAGGAETVLGKTLLSAQRVIAVSAAVMDAAQRLVPGIIERLSVIYTGLENPSVLPERLPGKAPRLLCLGRLIPDKGFDVAVAAFARIAPRFPHARLVIAGDGPARSELQKQAIELGIGDAVDVVGWVSPDRVPELLNGATLVMMPSRREGFPLTAIQAAQMARPVIAARVGGLPEAVVHGETGLLVPPDDCAALADAATFLLEHPKTATSIGTQARIRANELFGHERYLDAYATVYANLARRGDTATAPRTES